MADKTTMAQRRALRAAVRSAAVAMAKDKGERKTAEALGVALRTVQFWKSGTWPSYPASRRLAPLLGVDVAP